MQQAAGGDLQGIQVVTGQGRSEEEGQCRFVQQPLGQLVSADHAGIQLGLGHHAPLHRGGAEELHLAEDLVMAGDFPELEDAPRVHCAVEGDSPTLHQIEAFALLPLAHDGFPRQIAAQMQAALGQRRGKAGFEGLEFGVKAPDGVGLSLHGKPDEPDEGA